MAPRHPVRLLLGLAGERFRPLSAALWLACAVRLRPPSRMLQEDGSGWLTSHRRGTITAAARRRHPRLRGHRDRARVGPLLLGAGDDALIDTRNPSGSPTISPLVDIQGRIANQSDTELFTVKAPTPAYWRLTALDLFDGVDGCRPARQRRYRRAEGGLTNGNSNTLVQDYMIRVAVVDLVPSGVRAERISIGSEMSGDAEMASTDLRPATPPRASSTRSSRRSWKRRPTRSRRWRRRRLPVSAFTTPNCPTNFPANLSQLARDITANGTTQYEKALLLQNWFRKNFTYDLEVQRGMASTPSKPSSTSARATASSPPEPTPPSPASSASRPGSGSGSRRHGRARRAVPRRGQARPRLARGVLHRHRGCRSSPPRPAPRATRSSPACPSSKSVSSRSRRPRPRCAGATSAPTCRPLRWRPTATSAWPTCLSPDFGGNTGGLVDQTSGRPWIAGRHRAARPARAGPHMDPARAPPHPRPGPAPEGGPVSGRPGAGVVARDRSGAGSLGRGAPSSERDAHRVRRRPPPGTARDRRRRPRTAGRPRHRGGVLGRHRSPWRSWPTPTASVTR